MDYRLEVSPEPKSLADEAGPFVVNVARLTLDKPITSLTVTSQFTVAVNRPLPNPGNAAPCLSEVRRPGARRSRIVRPSSSDIPVSIADHRDGSGNCWLGFAMLANDSSVFAAASALMHAIHDEFAYDSDATEADTPPIEAFRARRGVCQDFAHIMIIALKHAGIPAAYVSGYLRTNPPPGKARLVGADATHAWVNVWCGADLGWIGFDPTNAILAGNDHIFTAMGRDYADVSPLNGVFIGRSGQRMKVSVDVAPLGA